MGKVMTDESVEKLLEQYEGEWIAFRVTERDEYGQPIRGELLAHSPKSADAYRAIGEPGDICVLYAGDLVPRGHEFAFAI